MPYNFNRFITIGVMGLLSLDNMKEINKIRISGLFCCFICQITRIKLD